MSAKLRDGCFLKSHSYDIYKEINLLDMKGDAVGLIIINKCIYCGKIKPIKINTLEHHRY